MDFAELKLRMDDCINSDDPEVAHCEADELLTKIALSTTLSELQRMELVNMWEKVEKWYA